MNYIPSQDPYSTIIYGNNDTTRAYNMSTNYIHTKGYKTLEFTMMVYQSGTVVTYWSVSKSNGSVIKNGSIPSGTVLNCYKPSIDISGIDDVSIAFSLTANWPRIYLTNIVLLK